MMPFSPVAGSYFYIAQIRLGQAHVSEKVLLPGGAIGPIRIVQQCLSAQLVGDAQTFQRSVAGVRSG